MQKRISRAIAGSTLFALTATSSGGCGYFLHPERRGQQSGSVDGATMVMDLLWLIPGIIPGVVALIVDFSSGAIYVGGYRHAHVAPNGRLSVRLPGASKSQRIELRLVTADRVLARHSAVLGAADQSIELAMADSLPPNTPLFLEVQPEGGATARFGTELSVDR
jgi:hypothetical protein